MEMGGEIATEFGEGLVNFAGVFGQSEGLCAADEGAGVVRFNGVTEGAVSGLMDEHSVFGELRFEAGKGGGLNLVDTIESELV